MSTIVTNSTNGSATFDPSHQYRYSLTRSWGSPGKQLPVTFIMLNPSQADANIDDPTIRACTQFAKNWKYTQLIVVNLFAYRTSQPSALKVAKDPIGPENDRHILLATETAKKIILAWGNWGSLLNRDKAVDQLLQQHAHKLHYLQKNNSGQPRHPLYIKRTTKPKQWKTL